MPQDPPPSDQTSDDDDALDWDLPDRDAFMAANDTVDYVPDIEPVVVVAEDE